MEQHETAPAPKKPNIDTFLNTFSVQAVKGLVLTKHALEGLARWLERRAKDADELATKLSSPEAHSTR